MLRVQSDVPGGELAADVSRLRALVRSGATSSLAWRLDQLVALRSALVRDEDVLVRALAVDLGKPAAEAMITEIGVVVAEIDYVRRHLAGWVRGDKVRVGLAGWPGRASVERCPLGVVLVVSPWNYPVYLGVMPVVSALAAGSCAVVKPSELAPATAAALARLLPAATPAAVVAEGGPSVVHEALSAGVDHLFFTGSTAVGRIVAESAGRLLVPVTLELGGKCPAVVDATVDPRAAARRIVWGKFANAGQTCVAPDYVLVHQEVADRFADEVCAAVRAFYGADPRRSPDYGRIVDKRHLDRLLQILEGHAGRVVLGGGCDPDDRYLAPTVVREPALSSRLMREEIFGPVLPVVAVADVPRALEVVGALPDPLAVYAFTRDAGTIRALRDGTRSGGFFVNVAKSQLGIAGLAFGGIGQSGTGSSRGRLGVEALSQHRSLYARPARPDLALHHPPYGNLATWLLRRMLHMPGRPRHEGAPTGRS